MTKRYERALTLDELAQVPEKDIDFSDIPELGEDFWANSVWVEPQRTRQITLRVKESVLDAYKATGRGYQTRMNSVLEAGARVLAKPAKQKAGMKPASKSARSASKR
jgi:uncharacterized protein (DUF4415 family)